MRVLSHLWAAGVLAATSIAGCNIHSGPGTDPNEFIDSGEDGGGSEGDAQTCCPGCNCNGGSGSGGSSGGNMSGSSNGGTTGSSGGFNQADATVPATDGGFSGSGSGSGSGGDQVADAGVDVNGACDGDAGACLTCCMQGYAGGGIQDEQTIRMCMCGASGACSTECVNEFCALKPYTSANDSCQQCVQVNLGLGGNCQSKCTDSNCDGLAACFEGCPAPGTGG